MCQQRPRLAEEVEGDVGEGDVLLELGRPRRPFGEAVGEDEAVVAEPERTGGPDLDLGHRFRTSSGMS